VFKVSPLMRHILMFLTCPQRLNGINASIREAGPDDTPEMLEVERLAAQEFIDSGL
jgi:SWI/SNF-related matrix-associated actin-dependent regulator of chromatin subfamily A member 5